MGIKETLMGPKRLFVAHQEHQLWPGVIPFLEHYKLVTWWIITGCVSINVDTLIFKQVIIVHLRQLRAQCVTGLTSTTQKHHMSKLVGTLCFTFGEPYRNPTGDSSGTVPKSQPKTRTSGRMPLVACFVDKRACLVKTGKPQGDHPFLSGPKLLWSALFEGLSPKIGVRSRHNLQRISARPSHGTGRTLYIPVWVIFIQNPLVDILPVGLFVRCGHF